MPTIIANEITGVQEMPDIFNSEKQRKWAANHPTARCFYWYRDSYDRMLNRSLEADDEFVEWCNQYYIQVHSDWVECPDDETVLLFALRWA